jgi:hypothetical protein
MSMREDWLLVGWARTKIGYLLNEHAWRLVTCGLSMLENCLLVGRACTKIGYLLNKHAWRLVTRWLSICKNHTPCFSSVHPFTHSSVPFFRPCLTSFVPCPLSHVSALFPVLCPMSYVCVPCPPSFGLCLTGVTSLFFASRPMSHVLRTSLLIVSRPLFLVSHPCSLSHVLWPISYISVPCLPSVVTSLCLCSFFSRATHRKIKED